MNSMEKTQDKIAVDVVLLLPDEIVDKAIEMNAMATDLENLCIQTNNPSI